MKTKSKKTFEEMYAVIDELIKKRKQKWTLKAVAWLDFEDIQQIIRIHIHGKWHLWDQKRPIGPWANRIITNQLRNIIRNNYGSFAKPCVSCSFSRDLNASEANVESFCGFTSSRKQCSECPLYAKWEKTKKNAHDLKLPLSLENHKNFYSGIEYIKSANFEKAESKLHSLMKQRLSDKHFFIYKMFFIDCLSDEEVASILKFKTTEKGRKAGYKQIQNLKKLFAAKAKEVVSAVDLFSDE